MLFSKKNCTVMLLFAMLVAISGSSCNSEKKIVKPEESRTITIVNKTENEIIYFLIIAADSDTIFEEDTNIKVNERMACDIPPTYKNTLELEVLLADSYNRVYAKKIQVPLNGNTDAVISDNDRKSEGWFQDRWKDFGAFLSKKSRDIRIVNKRTVTIVNKTKSEITSYRIIIADSYKILGEKKKIEVDEKRSHGIPHAFKNYHELELEVLLTDCHNMEYVKKIQVPLNGNTDAVITEKDRRSKGWFQDIFRAFDVFVTGKSE